MYQQVVALLIDMINSCREIKCDAAHIEIWNLSMLKRKKAISAKSSGIKKYETWNLFELISRSFTESAFIHIEQL